VVSFPGVRQVKTSASQHLPERHAKRVQIRTDVYAHPRELLGTGELRGPANTPGDEIPASEADSSNVFARPRSIILDEVVKRNGEVVLRETIQGREFYGCYVISFSSGFLEILEP
jgi:hypothetical protein